MKNLYQSFGSSAPFLFTRAIEELLKKRNLSPMEDWSSLKGEWTKTLFPTMDLTSPLPSPDFYRTQASSGHGCIGSYLAKFKRRESDRYPRCNVPETPYHVFYQCPRFSLSGPRDITASEPITLQFFTEVVRSLWRIEKEAKASSKN